MHAKWQTQKTAKNAARTSKRTSMLGMFSSTLQRGN